MKSMYIITGDILVMVAVVFLAPKKQNNTEDKASTPLDEIDAQVLRRYTDLFWKNCRPKKKNLAAKKTPNTSPERKRKSKIRGSPHR